MKKYDSIFVTNVPSFYKINLYNEIAKEKKIQVIFVSKDSNIRNKDFLNGCYNFDCFFLSESVYESRSRITTFFRLVKHLLRVDYNEVIFSGWETPELIPLMMLTPKRKNSIVVESSIQESSVIGIKGIIKKLILSRMSLAYPSGFLQNEILKSLNFMGKVKVTHGVGIINLCSLKKNNLANSKDDYKYIYVGRLSQEKNLEFLVDIFNSTEKQLTIVGEGPESDRLKCTSGPNIRYLGYVKNSDLPSLYAQHHVFILPSKSEPWGLVVDEALSCGLPVIVSDKVGCSEDLVLKLGTGEVFTFDDKHSLNNAIKKIELNYEDYKEKVINICWKERIEKQVRAYF